MALRSEIEKPGLHNKYYAKQTVILAWLNLAIEPGVEPAWRLDRAVKPDGVYLVNTTYKVSL